MNAKEELNLLIQLARVDNRVVHQEMDMIYYLGNIYGLSKEEVTEVFNDSNSILNINLLTKEEKYNCLYDLIHLMKVDKMVFQSEIKFCEKIAKRLGYRIEVIPELAAHIFSDSDILSNKDKVREIADEYFEV